MKKKIILLFIISLFLFLFSSCQSKKNVKKRVIFSISSDLSTLNPLYTFNLNEGRISELIYLGLVGHRWDESKGDLKSYPLLAKYWSWSKDHKSIGIKLRPDLLWSDSTKFRVDDIVFSFDAYSDPQVKSRFYGTFDNFITDKDAHINLKKTFDIISDDSLVIHFKKNSHPKLVDIDMPILPKHVFKGIKRTNYSTSKINFNTVGTGPYLLKNWLKNEKIVLAPNKNSFLYNSAMIPELIFKIIPDYNSRIIQLQKGEIDFLDEVRADDINKVKSFKNIKVVLQKSRTYDYVGWSNIDREKYRKSKVLKPNKFFGDPQVRRALTMGIDRKIIIDEFLQGAAELACSPVSPIFKYAVNKNVKPYKYDKTEALKLLHKAGWKDSDEDGILDKQGKPFSFTLYIPAGNPRRKFTSNIIKSNLKELGIDVNVQSVEPSVFFDNMFQKKYDAWVAGWTVPIPLELKPFWHSDLEKNIANCVGYKNSKVDSLLDAIEKLSGEKEIVNDYYKIQEQIHKDEPVTFLFWIDNITAFNSKIKNIHVNPLGGIQHCWEWRLSD